MKKAGTIYCPYCKKQSAREVNVNSFGLDDYDEYRNSITVNVHINCRTCCHFINENQVPVFVRSKVASSTVSHVLRDITKFSTAPFATVNQMVTMALGQLARAKNAASDAEAAGFLHFFEWIEHSKIPFNAYRPQGKDSKIDGQFRVAGEQITIRPGSAPSADDVDGMSDTEYKQLMRTVYFDLMPFTSKWNCKQIPPQINSPA